MQIPNIWSHAPGPIERWRTRVRESLEARWYTMRGRWMPYSPPPESGACGPRFFVSDFAATFEELEAITFHPDVLAAIEHPPAAAIVDVPPPAPAAPVGDPELLGTRRVRPARVYDFTPMTIELDMLELRMLELWDLVDVFIVCESPRAFGGFRKPLFLDRNLSRFHRFREKLLPIVVDDRPIAARYPGGRRTATDGYGEDTGRAEAWRTLRRQVTFEPDAVVISSDLDEIPPRHVVAWLRDFDVRMPLRLRVPALRYDFGWRDTQTFVDILAFSPAQFADVDRTPGLVRNLPARVLHSRGGVHLTSFLPPLGLLAKFAMAVDWERGILPFVRNEHGECASMMADHRWFGRKLSRYDADTDPLALIPWAARANRARYARYWP